MKSLIGTEEHVQAWLSCDSCAQLTLFLEHVLCAAIRGKKVSQLMHTEGSRRFCALLDKWDSDVETLFPPADTGSRFGNPSFRPWLEHVQAECFKGVGDIYGSVSDEASTYLCNSFGNWQRIDYGTGHELHFLAYLFCIHKHEEPDALVLCLLRYIGLARRLQREYWLEPAGSHGVWGLDDYSFLPFLLGAAQLAPHPHLRPKSIHNAELVAELAPEYVYLDSIRLIRALKSDQDGSSIRWHSPMLDDISAAKTWDKVFAGLMRMYREEVLGKLPIMQHFLLGRTISLDIKIDEGAERHPLHPEGHVHVVGNANGDCCGNALPSVHSAASAGRRLLPFD